MGRGGIEGFWPSPASVVPTSSPSSPQNPDTPTPGVTPTQGLVTSRRGKNRAKDNESTTRPTLYLAVGAGNELVTSGEQELCQDRSARAVPKKEKPPRGRLEEGKEKCV